jgi:hypothetical protein
MTPVFSPGEIRKVLQATGLTQHESGQKRGFFIADGRESRGEILVEVRRARYGTPCCDPTITEYGRRQLAAQLETCRAAIAAAGYITAIENGMVIVTDGQPDRRGLFSGLVAEAARYTADDREMGYW